MKNFFKFLFVFELFAFALNSNAEMVSLSLAAKVKSFNESHVVLDANGKTIKVKRNLINLKSIREGDAVLITLSDKKDIGAVLQ